MDRRLILVSSLVLCLILGCGREQGKTGRVVRVDYQQAEIKGGEWIQIDSFRFEHIGRRRDAEEAKYPVPSNEVIVDSMISGEKTRDYNPKTFPVYISKNIKRINKKLPNEKEILITDRFLMSYKGVLEVVKRDSSKIKVKRSEGYGAPIEVLER